MHGSLIKSLNNTGGALYIMKYMGFWAGKINYYWWLVNVKRQFFQIEVAKIKFGYKSNLSQRSRGREGGRKEKGESDVLFSKLKMLILVVKKTNRLKMSNFVWSHSNYAILFVCMFHVFVVATNPLPQ